MCKPKFRKIASEAVIQTQEKEKKKKRRKKKEKRGRERSRERDEEVWIFVFLIGDVGFSLMKKTGFDVWVCDFL